MRPNRYQTIWSNRILVRLLKRMIRSSRGLLLKDMKRLYQFVIPLVQLGPHKIPGSNLAFSQSIPSTLQSSLEVHFGIA